MANKNVSVYGEVLGEIKIQSMQNETTKYVVRYGNVSWNKDEIYKKVIYVIMEYKGIINYMNPPHYMVEPDGDGVSDVTKVINAIEDLRRRFNV